MTPHRAQPTTDAASRLRRLLTVLPVIATGDEITLEELERRTGVNARTLLDDLTAVINRVDDSGEFVQSISVRLEQDRVAVHASHFHRPTRLTIQELAALELGLAMHIAATPPDERSAAQRARERIQRLIVETPADDPDAHWHASPPPLGDAAVVRALREAVAARREVAIAYRKGSDTEARERVVRPYTLVASHGTWYLVAGPESSPEHPHFYRADRIERVILRDDVFALPDGFDVSRLVAGGKPFASSGAATMTVRYTPRVARWIAERERVPVAEDGSVTVEHPLADEHWAVRHVLQYGPDAEVLAPESVRRAVVERLGAMRAAI